MKSTTIQYSLSAPTISTVIRKPSINIKGVTSVRFVLSGFEDIFNPAVKLEVLWGDTTTKTNFFRPLAYNYKTQSILNEVIYGELAGTLFAHYDHVFSNNTTSYNYPLTSQFLITFKNGKTVYIYQPLNIFKGSYYDDIANLDILNTQITPTSSNNTIINFEGSNDQTYISVLRSGTSLTFDNTNYNSTCIPLCSIGLGSLWVGLGSNNNWSTVANWAIDRVPTPFTSIYFGNAPRLSAFNNLVADTPYNGITFNYSAGAYTLSGNSFMLYSGGITNNSTNLQIIANNIAISGTNGIPIACNTADIALSGIISGANSLVKTGTATLNLIRSNTYTGGTTISAGTIKMGSLSPIGSGGLILLSGSTLDLNGYAYTFDNVITSNVGSRIINTGANINPYISLKNGQYNSLIDDSMGGSISLILGAQGTTPVFTNLNNKIRGSVWIPNGSATVANLNVGSFGTGNISIGNSSNIPSLIYNGSADSNIGSRAIEMTSAGGTGGGAIISNNGAGVLTLSGAFAVSGTLTKLLTLSGTNSGNNTVAGIIANSTIGTDIVSLEKRGTGKWILSGANTYTGTTSISAGTLVSVKGIATASFTIASLTVDFLTPPSIGQTYRFFPGSTIQTYASVMLIGAPGRTGSYNKLTSTLTIA